MANSKFKISVFDERNGSLLTTLEIDYDFVKIVTGIQLKAFNEYPVVSLHETEIEHFVRKRPEWEKWFDLSAEWELEILD